MGGDGVIAVYQITNLANGRFYIGSTNDVKHRMGQHFSKNKLHTKLFAEDIEKYGRAGFEVKILEECSLEDLREKEAYYIEKLKPQYNRVFKGYTVTDDVRNKISKTLTGRKTPREVVEKQRQGIIRHWKTHKRKPTYGNSKKVFCDGTEYPSMKELAKAINGKAHSIAKAIKRDGKYKGHEVRFVV